MTEKNMVNPCKEIPLPDDLDFARGKVPYRSKEWYEIRDRLIKSLAQPLQPSDDGVSGE